MLNERWWLSCLLIFLVDAAAFAQTLQISKNSNYATADNAFTFNETLYARVTASQINYTDLEKSDFRLDAATFDDEVEGVFTNLFNGTYTAAIALSPLNRAENHWEFRVELKDKQGNEFKASVNLTIQNILPPPIVGVLGSLEALTPNTLTISQKTIFVDAATKITEIGQPLKFSDLRLNWKVDVRAEKRADSLLWALTIDVLERVSINNVEAEGLLANLQDSVMIVNDINFRVVHNTILQNRSGGFIGLPDFRAGMAVEAQGVTDRSGKIIAKFIKIKNDNFSNQEIQFTGIVNALFARAPLPDSVRVNGDLFEVSAQTELRGFNNEGIAVMNLRRGETLEMNARTRQNLPALALKIQRQKPSGEVQVKGRVERRGDSSLVVSNVEFFYSPTLLVLDDENLLIPISSLAVGLMVEVRANRQSNSRLAAVMVQIEDDATDEIALTGFVEALTDTTIKVSSAIFLVNAATVVMDQNAARIPLAALQTRMMIAIRGDRRFDNSVLAKEIRIEDFLQPNEIELRGEIVSLSENSVRAAGIDFSRDAQTVILDLNGAVTTFSRLMIGTIVQIRAKASANNWQATRIKIENEIDSEITLTGAIDSLRTNAFYALRRLVRSANTTLYFGLNNEPLQLNQLRANEVVEILGRVLPDSSLLALRIKKINRNTNEIEARGQITRRNAAEITVASVTILFDATTVFFDAENRPITATDLRDGEIVIVQGLRQINGALLAQRVQMRTHRVLTGVISELLPNGVTISGLQHRLTAQTYLVDEQNHPIGVNEIKTQQQVRMVAYAVNGGWEVLNVRILFRDADTGVETFEPTRPKHFVLQQNFPNPFLPQNNFQPTSIRFELPQPAEISLTIYNQLGQKIRIITTGRLLAGVHDRSWDGRNEVGALVASGVYFYRLQAGASVITRRMIILR